MYLGVAARPQPVRVNLNAPHRTLSIEARFNDHAPRRASSPWFRSPFPASHERQGTRVINPVQSGVYTHSYVVRHDFASSRARRTITQPIQGPVAANTRCGPLGRPCAAAAFPAAAPDFCAFLYNSSPLFYSTTLRSLRAGKCTPFALLPSALLSVDITDGKDEVDSKSSRGRMPC